VVWQLSDPYGVEEDIEALGPDAWNVWRQNVLPDLLVDPTARNQTLRIERTTNDLVWFPGTDIYVRFELISGDYVLLIGVVDLKDLI
jgi:hypothetical protein